MKCFLCDDPDLPLFVIDKLRLYCFRCKKTFAKLACPECGIKYLEIAGQNKFLCTNIICDSRPGKFFSLSERLAHLKQFYSPFTLPGPKPKKKLFLERNSIGLFTIYKVWPTQTELDIVIELPHLLKNSSDYIWRWNPEAHTITIEESDTKPPKKENIPLTPEMRAKKIREVHDRKTVSRYLVITFLFEPTRKKADKTNPPSQ